MAPRRENSFRRPGQALAALLVLGVSTLAAPAALARGFRVSQVPNGEFFGCDLCHVTPGGPRNPFGSDVEATLTPLGDVDWGAIFELDSDEDGFGNGVEMGDPDGDGIPIDGVNPSNPGLASSFPGPDIIVLAEANRSELDPGDTVELTIDVFNVGSETAQGVQLTLPLEAGVTVESFSSSQGDCGDDGQRFACDLGEVPPQFGARIVLVLRVDEVLDPDLSLVLNATLDGTDIDASNNESVVDVRVREIVPETRFHRGDANADGALDISDPLRVFGFLFLGDSPPDCDEAADANNDGALDISDGVALLAFLFNGGAPPPAPGPPGEDCGVDPDASGSPGDLGCVSYPPCA